MKNSRNILNTIFVGTIFLLSLNAMAEMPHNKNLLRSIRDITKQCAVEVVSMQSEKVVGYRSQCAIFTVDSSDVSHVFINGEWLTAKLVPSKDADGDDLAHLIVFDSKGNVVATKRNVLSFGNVLYAMAGDTENFIRSRE